MSFNLDLPSTDTVTKQVETELMVPTQTTEAIAGIVPQKVQEIVSIDMDSFADRKAIASVFENFGTEEMSKSSQKNNFLQMRIKDFQSNGGESGEIATNLAQLSEKMKDLDPSGLDFTKTGPLGSLFNPIRGYFNRYKKADQEIASIVESLEKGEKTLKADNITLELEIQASKENAKETSKKIQMAEQLNAALTSWLETHPATTEEEDERVKFIQEEILFPLRQRIMDLQSMQAVNQQGIIAMDLIRKNNLELLRGTSRAKTVTITALRTAVTIAGALYHQKIVLEKITTLNQATSAMIESTARMLKDQGTKVHQMASESMINPESLKKAYQDTFQALDDIENYKQKALPQIQATIDSLQTMIDQGQKRLNTMEKRDTYTLTMNP